MLHSTVYNEGLPRELRDAFARRDHLFFHARIIQLAAHVAKSTPTDPNLDRLLSDLHIALGLHDALVGQGETVSLLTDFVNL